MIGRHNVLLYQILLYKSINFFFEIFMIYYFDPFNQIPSQTSGKIIYSIEIIFF